MEDQLRCGKVAVVLHRGTATPTNEPTIPRNSIRVVAAILWIWVFTACSREAALEPVRTSASSYSGTWAHFGIVDASTSTWNWTPHARLPTRSAWTAQC